MIRRAVSSPVFIGRRAEVDVLERAQRDLAQSRGSLILIGGEAGIGKSRLLAQFMRSAATGRTRNVVSTECLERARQPFGPLRELVDVLGAKLDTRDAIPANVRRARQQLTLLDPESAAGSDTPPLEKAQLFAALVSFFQLVARKRATIVAIEDLGWADESTLEFLTYAVPKLSLTRLMIVATYRPDQIELNPALAATLARLTREPSVTDLVLEPLPAGEIQALMAAALGDIALPEPTKRGIEERCEGNPFFAEELLKSALSTPEAAGPVALPLSIRSTILDRLRSFSADERRVLAHAAVLGYRFDPTFLAAVMHRDLETILPILRRARSLQILGDDPGERALCRFRHALTRRTIYEEILAFESRRLHHEILATLESLGDTERHIDELAYHAWEAKDSARSLAYNERAGEAALALRALPEAAICFARALEAATDDGDRARLLTRAGSIAQLQGRLRESIVSFEAALARRIYRGEFDEAALIVGWIMGDRTNLGEDDAVVAAEMFLRDYGDRLSVPSRDGLAALIARLFSARYDFVAVDRLLAHVSNPAGLQPRAHQNYVIANLNRHLFCGDADAWRASANEFTTFAATVPLFMRIVALYTIAQTGTYLGPTAHDRVEAALDEADALATEWTFGGIELFGTAVRAEYLWLRGRLSAARACAERILAEPEFFVARQVLAHVAPLLALALGDDGLARRTLGDERDGTALACDSDRDSLAARGTWHAARGRHAEAMRDLGAALEGLAAPMPFNATLLTSCVRYLPLAEAARVTALLQPAELGARDRAAMANAAFCRAIVHERAGAGAEARDSAADAQQLYGQLGWPLFEARAAELAGADAVARALYERCGATADIARLATANTNGAGHTPAPAPALSVREQQVARCVTRGLTNVAIAAELSVSVKTIEKNLSTIFAKLGIRSRAQIAAYVAREERERTTA